MLKKKALIFPLFERPTQSFVLLVYFSHAFRSQVQITLKLRTWSSNQITHMGGRDWRLWAILCRFPDCAAPGNRKQSQDLKPGTLMEDVGKPTAILTTRPNIHPRKLFRTCKSILWEGKLSSLQLVIHHKTIKEMSWRIWNWIFMMKAQFTFFLCMDPNAGK